MNFLLVKIAGKTFSGLKILITKEFPFLNSGQLNLLFRFTGY